MNDLAPFLVYDVIMPTLEWGPVFALLIYLGWKVTYALLKNTKLKKSSIKIISIPVIIVVLYTFLQYY